MVFQIVTLDSWTSITYNIFHNVIIELATFVWFYFATIVILGGFILVNLTLAVIKVHFSEAQGSLNEDITKIKS